MAIAIDDIIDADDYNGIRNKIVKVLGDNGVDDKIGYGRAISSTAKTAGDVISASDMTALFTDLEKIRNHHTGFATSNASFTWGYSDGLNAPDSAEIVGVFAADVGPTDSQDATTDTDEGFIDFDSVATNASTFADNFPTSFPGTGSFSVDDLVSDVRTTNWNGSISHQVTIRWATADQRRYFFNAGGRIRFASSLTGGNSVPGDQTATYPSNPEYQKDEIWQTMLNVMETIDFGRDRTTQPGTASGSPAAAIGNYQLTNSDQVIFTKTGSGVYAENYYEIKARNVDTRSIRFTVSYVDADIGDDRIADGYNYRVDENISGDITSVIKSVTPSSFLGIAAPSFVADTTLEGSTPSTSYSLAASETEVNEGGSFDITLTTTGLSNGTQVPYTITGIDTNDIGGTALTGNLQINSNSATLTINVSEDFTNDGGDETFSLTLDNGLGGTAEVIIHDTSLATSYGGWPSAVPHAGWGTKVHSVTNTGSSASATADFKVTNNGNGVITVTSRTFDGSEATLTEYSGTITYSNTVGTVTVEAAYNASTQNNSGGATNPLNSSITAGTFYTIAVGASRTFTWNAVDSDASSSTASIGQAAGVSFDIRISDDNGSTTRSSATGLLVDLEAYYTETAQSINTTFGVDDNNNGNIIDGDERIGFKLLSDGTTEIYKLIYATPAYVINPSTVIDWLPASLQGANEGSNYEWRVVNNSASNSVINAIYDGAPTRVPATGDTYNASTDYWEVVQDFYGTYADVRLYVGGTEVYNQRYQPPASAQTKTTIFLDGKTYYRGGTQTGYSYTQRWGYYYETSQASFGTWYNGANALTVYASGTESGESGTAQVNLKIRKVGAGTAYDVNQSVNLNANLLTAASAVALDGALSGTSHSFGLTGSCSVSLNWNATTVDVSAFGNPGSDTSPQTWRNSGAASDYEVRYVYTDGTTGSGSISGPGTGWLTADANYTWRVDDSGTSPEASTMSGTLYIRDAVTNNILAQQSVSMSANNNP